MKLTEIASNQFFELTKVRDEVDVELLAEIIKDEKLTVTFSDVDVARSFAWLHSNAPFIKWLEDTCSKKLLDIGVTEMMSLSFFCDKLWYDYHHPMLYYELSFHVNRKGKLHSCEFIVERHQDLNAEPREVTLVTDTVIDVLKLLDTEQLYGKVNLKMGGIKARP